MSNNLTIKIPTSHYVGFQYRNDEKGLPLGFMTPEGTDKAAAKRKATVDGWCGVKGNQRTLDNKPMSGFKLAEAIRRYASFGNGNVKWRVEDPRGFELEISSDNLAFILSYVQTDCGEIMEPCIWARNGAENVLVPTNSDEYKDALENTNRVKKTASTRGLKVGQMVTTQQGVTGVYMGQFYNITMREVKDQTHHFMHDFPDIGQNGQWGYRHSKDETIQRHFIAEVKDGLVTDIHVMASLKLSEVGDLTEWGELQDAQAEQIINKAMFSGADVHSSVHTVYSYRPVLVSRDENPALSIIATPITSEEIKAGYDDLMRNAKHVYWTDHKFVTPRFPGHVVVEHGGRHGLFSAKAVVDGKFDKGYLLDSAAYTEQNDLNIQHSIHTNTSNWGFSRGTTRKAILVDYSNINPQDLSLTTFKAEIKTAAGNTFQMYV